MTSNLGFPSNKGKEIEFTPGFSAQEKKYLSRKTVKKLPLRFDFIDWFFIFIFLVSFILGGQIIEKFHLFSPAKAEAHETYDNAWYCLHKDAYFIPERSTLTEYCANHGN